LTLEHWVSRVTDVGNMMIRNVAAGLAIAAITIGASTLSAAAGVGKGSMGWSINGHRPHAHGTPELTPHERIHLRAILGERYDRLSPVERARLIAKVGERVAELTPRQRMRLRANAYGHVAGLTPRERERRYHQGLYFGRR